MGSEFSIQKATRDNVGLFRVSGRLDAKNAQQLMTICRAARESGQTQIVVNLGDVTFVASSGIGTLLALTEEFREAAGAIHLVSLSDAVVSVVELLNLGQFLNVGRTEEEALQSAGAGA